VELGRIKAGPVKFAYQRRGSGPPLPIDPGELPPLRQLTTAPMAPHIASSVFNLDTTVRRPRAAGHTVISSELAEGRAFITDPSRNVIEFNSTDVRA
jgi:hypothetical protein